jgi:hypothetical protein
MRRPRRDRLRARGDRRPAGDVLGGRNRLYGELIGAGEPPAETSSTSKRVA